MHLDILFEKTSNMEKIVITTILEGEYEQTQLLNINEVEMEEKINEKVQVIVNLLVLFSCCVKCRTGRALLFR